MNKGPPIIELATRLAVPSPLQLFRRQNGIVQITNTVKVKYISPHFSALTVGMFLSEKPTLPQTSISWRSF